MASWGPQTREICSSKYLVWFQGKRGRKLGGHITDVKRVRYK